MAKKGGDPTQTTTTTPDEATQAYLQAYRQALLKSGSSMGSLNPYSAAGASMAGNEATAGLAGGLETGAQGIEKYMNPYTQQVIDATTPLFNRQRAIGVNQANDLATKAGAFGGDRGAVLQAMSNRDVNQNEASTVAGLRSAGYDSALNSLTTDRARLGQMGQAGLSGILGAGQQLSQQQLQMLGLMNNGVYGGGSTSQTATHTPDNPFGDILGLGMNFLPGGALAGLGRRFLGKGIFNTLGGGQ